MTTPPPTSTSRRKQQKSGSVGRIVAVPGGGHIVRSTGRKDRHSKVCTAKGLRDRRVRLSAHTAIEFYDVQDRLGYDRPSMAVDWLIKNARAAIDRLDRLPPWQPTAPAPGPTAAHVRDLRLSLDSSGPSHAFSFDMSTSSAPLNADGGGIGVFGFPDRNFFTQREPLQSTASPSNPFWIDSMAHASPASLLDAVGGFSSFRMPSWSQGDGRHCGNGSGEPSSSRLHQ